MAQISVANIFRHSKATLLKFGAIDWIADAVAEAIAKSESVGIGSVAFTIWRVIASNFNRVG